MVRGETKALVERALVTAASWCVTMCAAAAAAAADDDDDGDDGGDSSRLTRPLKIIMNRRYFTAESVRASPSLQVFRSRLKTELFARSYSCSD